MARTPIFLLTMPVQPFDEDDGSVRVRHKDAARLRTRPSARTVATPSRTARDAPVAKPPRATTPTNDLLGGFDDNAGGVRLPRLLFFSLAASLRLYLICSAFFFSFSVPVFLNPVPIYPNLFRFPFAIYLYSHLVYRSRVILVHFIFVQAFICLLLLS